MKKIIVTATSTPETLAGDLKTANTDNSVRRTDTWLQTGTLIFMRILAFFKRARPLPAAKNISKITEIPETDKGHQGDVGQHHTSSVGHQKYTRKLIIERAKKCISFG